MREMFTFDDVLIVPKFSMIESRSPEHVDISTKLRELKMGLPVISANMDTITGARMSQAMQGNGAQACLHRFGTIDQTVQDFLASRFAGGDGAMVSIGLGNNELERAEALFKAGAHTFVIDVAHGANIAVVRQTKALREILGPYVNIVVGNFATGESVQAFLDHSGAIVDAFKVGIGPGSACTTRIKTGVGVPQLSAVLDVAQTLKKTDIVVVADGGMKTPGDISKALAAGAKMVMLGGMFAGTEETPGEVVQKASAYDAAVTGNWTKYKKYRGSASMESYIDQGKVAKYRAAEGEAFMVPYKGPVSEVLQDIEGGIRSMMTYVGAANLKELPGKVEFVRISGATIQENGAHGKRQ